MPIINGERARASFRTVRFALGVLGGAILVASLWACRAATTAGGIGAPLGPSLPGDGSPASGEVVAGPVAPRGEPRPAPDQAQDRASGTLLVVIRWPERDAPRFRAAAIPNSSRTVILSVSRGGTAVERAILRRDGGSEAPAHRFKLPVGNGYALDVKAFREADPGSDAVPIAAGNATFNIAGSVATRMGVLLAATQVPRIEGIEPNAGGVGEEIKIRAAYDRSLAELPRVLFAGAPGSDGPAASVSADADGALRVVVPAGASAGQVHIVVDGIRSVSDAVFWVVERIALLVPASDPWDASGPGSRVVLLGQTLRLGATYSFSVAPGTRAGDLGTPPTPGYRLSDARAGTITSEGAFTAGNIYASSSVNTMLGSTSSAALMLVSEDVQVSISPASATMGPGGVLSARFVGINTLSDGSTNSLVTYQSDAANLVEVDPATGLARIADASSYGVLAISAVSSLPVQRAPARAEVTRTALKVSTLVESGWNPFMPKGCGDGERQYTTISSPAGVAFNEDYTFLLWVDVGRHLFRATSVSVAWTDNRSGECGQAGFSDGRDTGVRFSSPTGVARSPRVTDLCYIADRGNNRIRSAIGEQVSTLAGSGNQGHFDGPSGLAEFNEPFGIAADQAGNVYVAERGWPGVRKIDTAGKVSTLAGSGGPYLDESGGPLMKDGMGLDAVFYRPAGLAVGPDGTLYLADLNAIRSVSPAGLVSTVAGGAAAGSTDGQGQEASFSRPIGVATDDAGNLWVADTDNNCVRWIDPQGIVTTVAGRCGLAGDSDELGTSARFSSPTFLAITRDGRTIYVSDAGNAQIRKLTVVP